MKKQKQKIIEILLTALLSAGIAFLQSLLASHFGHDELKINPENAGAIGMIIKSIRSLC